MSGQGWESLSKAWFGWTKLGKAGLSVLKDLGVLTAATMNVNTFWEVASFHATYPKYILVCTEDGRAGPPEMQIGTRYFPDTIQQC